MRVNFALITYLLNTFKNCVDVQMCIKVCFEIRTHIKKKSSSKNNLSLIRRCIIINELNENNDKLTGVMHLKWIYLVLVKIWLLNVTNFPLPHGADTLLTDNILFLNPNFQERYNASLTL